MMKNLLFTLLVVACCNTGFSQNDEKANVLAVERSTADAFSKHNLPNINSAFADDASIITQKGELVTKQQLLQYVQRVNSLVVSDLQVKIKGNNIAIVTGTQVETGKDNSGSAYSTKSRFTDVLEKRNGNWIIIASQATSIGE
jgi:ketosteroid isomerase-like protein